MTTPVTPSPSTPPATSEAEIRDYANHLYVQRGSVNGHEHDDWLEAAHPDAPSRADHRVRGAPFDASSEI